MNEQSKTVCKICGHKCKPRGLGAHMRLKHGIKVETVVKHISESSGDISEAISRSQRPSDYIKKKSQVVETRVEQIFRGPDELGRMMCKNCGGWWPPDNVPSFYECVKGKKHEF